MKTLIPKIKLSVPVFNELANAFKQIEWPSLKAIVLNLLAVLVISAIIGAYLWLLDTGFEQLRNFILF